MTTRKIHTATFKAQVVQQVLREDKTLAQIAAQHGIHPNQISQWKATALQGLPTIFERGDGAQAADKAAHEKQTEKLYEQIGGPNPAGTGQANKKVSGLISDGRFIPTSVGAYYPGP